MALKNYTTSVAVEKTVSDIHMILAKSGAKKIMFDYEENGEIRAICFSINTPTGECGVKLPGNTDRVHAVLRRQKKDPKVRNRSQIDDSREQAARVAWRIVKDWLDAQLAILETEMVDVQQVFLPYMVNSQGQTVYELFSRGALMLTERGAE